MESRIKRFEPMGFLLVLGMITISVAMGFTLYKFRVNLANGTIVAPPIDQVEWNGVTLLVVGVVLHGLAVYFFKIQKLNLFRTFYGVSFFVILFFFILLSSYLFYLRPTHSSGPEVLGEYYFSYIIAFYMLFLLLGLVGHGLILSRIYNRVSYVDSFIFSVNPPNILNIKLSISYMFFMLVLWVSIVIFINNYAA
jgi:cytochrome c oxidase subunit 3